MADTKIAKTKKPTKEAAHPKYSEMVASAIESLKEKGGSSRMAIIKFITNKYKVSDNSNVVNSRLKLALKKGVESGTLTQVKGTGASGSFKLAKKAAAKPKAAKEVTPKATKSPKKTKSKVVKSPKKLKVAKSPKKATVRKPAKKAKSPKKVAKPKKSPAKKTAKKAATPKAKKPADKKPAKK